VHAPSIHSSGIGFSLRRAVREDFAGLLRLIVALADFEKLTPPDAEASRRLVEDGFGERPRFESWLAFVDGESQPVGYALCFETYSSFLARPVLFLEDIFVLPGYRGRGIGTALLNLCINLAAQRGCGRMEWVCLDWNTKAQCVYEKLGARRLAEWFPYRLDRATIVRLSTRPGEVNSTND
jgi:GNAT superfamily N-acetyltransferase